MNGCQRLAIALIGTLLLLSVILYTTHSMRMVPRSQEMEHAQVVKRFKVMAAEARGREDMCRKEVGEKDRVIRELEAKVVFVEDQIKEYRKSLHMKDASIMRSMGHKPRKSTLARMDELDLT